MSKKWVPLVWLGVFLLFGVGVAFLLQRVMDEPNVSPAPVVEPAPEPEPVPADTLDPWHEAPPDSVPPPDPDREHPGRGRDKDK